MVQLTLTPAAKAAITEYHQRKGRGREDEGSGAASQLKFLSEAEIGSPVDHHDLVQISKYLVQHSKGQEDDVNTKAAKPWRLDTLLKGATVYQPPPLPKAEPTPEYKALMRRLRAQEEQRQYERMLNPPVAPETFGHRSSHSTPTFNPATSHGATAADEVDEMTYADVNRQVILIINVLVSIICTSVFIWIAARRWSVPQRLGLSMSGSGIVAVAEVVIYMGYVRRLQEAKQTEVKTVETKEITDTWIIDKAASTVTGDSTRFRKGKHR